MTEPPDPHPPMIARRREPHPTEAGSQNERDVRRIAEMVRDINHSLEVDHVFPLIAQHAAQLVGGRGACVGLIEHDALAIVGASGSEASTLGDRIPVTSLPMTDGDRGIVSAPLVVGGRMIGTLAVSGEPHAFDARDATLLRSLADHAAISIENAQLYQASVRMMRHANVLATAARALALNVEPHDIHADIARIALESLGADGVTICLVNEAANAAQLVLSEGAGAEASQERLDSFVSNMGGRVARSGVPEFRRDLRAYDAEPMVQRLLRDSIASVALLPLLVEGRPRGLLILRFLTMQPFDDEQRQLFVDFSALAAVAMRNALLIADLARGTIRVTEAERRRQQQQQTLATALESMEQAVFICSPSAVIRYANSAAIREYGYAFGEFVGMHARELTVRRSPISVMRDDAPRSGVPAGVWVGEQVQRRKDGSEFPAWVTISTIHSPDGDGAGVVVTVRNLAEEQRMAAQLREAEKLVALGELVAGVAHEVNNPLTGISSFAQLLLEEPLPPEQLDAVRLIKREADRAVGVVRDLLTFARKAEPRIISVDVHALIDRTIRLCTYRLRTAGVEVELALAPDLRRVRGDDRQLQQVLLNLIVNAEHAMATTERRVLAIRAANELDQVVIAVSDTGIGMTPEVQRRAFEPFFTTKPEGMGTGLGLSISYGIVHMHGGRLLVESAPGDGATFRIVLPALDRGAPPSSSHPTT
ncbi:MAG TPA: ATP-binding protein [Gemmatimonadaceae bacterium]|nr:ATP-binding protein [Gemmatimonadaceae bacterium]